RAMTAPLLLHEPAGLVKFVAAKRVAAHELGKPVGLMNRRCPDRTHFVQRDRHAARGDLPGRFAPRQATADNPDHQALARLRLVTVFFLRAALGAGATSIEASSRTGL